MRSDSRWTQAAICIAQPHTCTPTETFIQAHAERLPGPVSVLTNVGAGRTPLLAGESILSPSVFSRARRKLTRAASRRPWGNEVLTSYLVAFRKTQARAVLAEYGPTGVAVMKACRVAKLPLVVHFHGYDASRHDVLDRYRESYRAMFEQANAIVVVSRAMQRRLAALGAPENKLVYNPYGVDQDKFFGASPETQPPVFLAVGRFTEKKAPHLTILAFAEVHRANPDARLRMIGDGHLLPACRDLVIALGIQHAVTFLGVQPHGVVCSEMRQARAFVQHSIEAPNGDCEGTPVSILEAAASGLPVISTNHAGIPDVVIDGNTGFVVDERDVSAMAERMRRIAASPELAGQLGKAGCNRVRTSFSMEGSIRNLWQLIKRQWEIGPTLDGLIADGTPLLAGKKVAGNGLA